MPTEHTQNLITIGQAVSGEFNNKHATREFYIPIREKKKIDENYYEGSHRALPLKRKRNFLYYSSCSLQ